MAAFEMKGLAELSQALKELPDRIAKNVLRGAVNAGATVIRKEAELRAPEYHGDVSKGHPPPGTLKKSIRQKRIANASNDGRQIYIVYVKKGTTYTYANSTKGRRKKMAANTYQTEGGVFYWRFVEFGTSKMAARPFMRPAFEVKKQAAVEAIRDYLAKRIPKEVEKLPKRI